jgi:hypothetical protein
VLDLCRFAHKIGGDLLATVRGCWMRANAGDASARLREIAKGIWQFPGS